MNLIKVYVVLFRRPISPEEYAERARLAFGYGPGATVVGIPPSDETFAKNAIREVCGDIWSMTPIPEVKTEKGDPQNFRNEPIPGGGMKEYAINFLKRKISEGEDPDYFNLAGYNVNVNTSADRITGDGALIIHIYSNGARALKPPEASAARKYCIYCGSEMPVEGMYCPRCGKKQVEEEIKGTKEAEAVAKLQKPAKMGFLDRLRGKPDVKSLRERGDVEELVKALSHGDWHVRWEAAEALGELGDRRAVPALIGALEDKIRTNWMEARQLLEALVKMKDPDSVTSLLRILQDPRSNQPHGDYWPICLWRPFVQGLGAIGGPDSVKALKSALEHKDWDVHLEAVEVLERMRETSTDPSIRADISAALEKARKDRSEYRKLDVLEALKSVESYRVKIFPKAEVRWPNCCCLCLGPVEMRETVSGWYYTPPEKGKITYREVSADGVPYCKFCHEEARVPGIPSRRDAKTGAEIARGVEIQVDYLGNVTLIFKNPEYGKIFAQANPFLY